MLFDINILKNTAYDDNPWLLGDEYEYDSTVETAIQALESLKAYQELGHSPQGLNIDKQAAILKENKFLQ